MATTEIFLKKSMTAHPCARVVLIAIFMVFFAGVCFLAVLPGYAENEIKLSHAERDPALQALLDKAGIYAREYRRHFRDLVGEEKMEQSEFDKKGRVKERRSFTSDYLFVLLPSDPSSVVEVRDIQTINGKPEPRKKRGILELFEKKSSGASEEAERLVKESTKHNLGRKRYTNMVNFGLTFLLPENQEHIVYELAAPEADQRADVAVLKFREATEHAAMRAVTPFGRFPIPSQGQIWLSLPEARVLKFDFSFRQDDKFYAIAGRYLSEYQNGPDGLLVPARFQEYFYDIISEDVESMMPHDKDPLKKKSTWEETKRLTFASEATYSNFRRFSTDVNILPAAIVVEPAPPGEK